MKRTAKKLTVAFYLIPHSGFGLWDPQNMETYLSGAEEALVSMADALASIGCSVTVFGIPHINSPYSDRSANPRYVYTTDLNQDETFDVAISWRMSQIAHVLRRVAKKVYFWPQDFALPMKEGSYQQFDDVLWLSEIQRAQWVLKNPSFARFTHVFGTGIQEELFRPLKERKNPYSCVYAGRGQSGLGALLQFWPMVKCSYPQATLDLCWSGDAVEGNDIGMADPYLQTLKALSSFDAKCHGRLSPRELNALLEESAFWVFPCINTLPFCMTALKAQYAGAMPVIVSPESCMSSYVRYGWSCSRLEDFLRLLLQALHQAEKIHLKERSSMRSFIQKHYTATVIARRWKELFERHLSEPVFGQRSLPK